MLSAYVGLDTPDSPVESVSRMRLQADATLGNYRLLFRVASGGMAEVWVARQHGARGFHKLVALKMILPELATEATFERMFAEEARLAAHVRHPNVCEVYELVELHGLLALSMEWVDGHTLAQLLEGRGPLEPRVAARIVAEAAAGLHAAHEARGDADELLNLVHRDVSPQNILISRDGHIKLSDFGIAKALNGAGETTEVGQVKGKSSYMSPEQAQGFAIDRRSDVFSLGVVLYVVSLGKRPFRAVGARAVTLPKRRLDMDFERPHRVNPHFPRELEAIIERALQRDPAQRYQTAADLRSDLEEWLASSGPLLTETDVARVVDERRGGDLEERESSIRDALTTLPRRALVSHANAGSLSSLSAPDATPTLDETGRVKAPAFSSPLLSHRSWPQWPGAHERWFVLLAALLAIILSDFGLRIVRPSGLPVRAVEAVHVSPVAPRPRSVSPRLEPELAVQPLPPVEPESPLRGVSGGSSSLSLRPTSARTRTGTPTKVGKPSLATKRIGPTERDL
jgi:serine/threonine protein kinase